MADTAIISLLHPQTRPLTPKSALGELYKWSTLRSDPKLHSHRKGRLDETQRIMYQEHYT